MSAATARRFVKVSNEAGETKDYDWSAELFGTTYFKQHGVELRPDSTVSLNGVTVPASELNRPVEPDSILIAAPKLVNGV